MRRQHEVRTRGLAGPVAQHVAHFVDPHVLQAEFAELARVELAALGFLEGRRLHLADLHLLGQRARLVGAGRIERGLHGDILQQLGAKALRALLGWGERGDEQQGGKDG